MKLAKSLIGLELICSILAYTLFRFSSLIGEADINYYMRYVHQCDIIDSPLYLILNIYSYVSCNVAPLLVEFAFAFLSILTINFILLLFNSYLPRYLSYILCLNPLSIAWLSTPSKESFVIIGTVLILSSFNSYLSLPLFFLGVVLLLHVRIFLFPLAFFILLVSLFPISVRNMSRNLSFTKFSLRINKLYFLIYLSLILSIPLLSFVFLKYFSLAELATTVLDEKGYRDLPTVSSINFLSISFNSFVLIFFSFFSSSAAKVFYVFFNLTLLYALYRSTFRVGVIFLLYHFFCMFYPTLLLL